MADDIVDRLRIAETAPLDADTKVALFLVLQDARAEITRLREERRWIPVEERLPENILGKAVMRRILATDGDSVAEAKYYEGYGFESVHGEELWFTPTHWQPLPAPPSEGEVEG